MKGKFLAVVILLVCVPGLLFLNGCGGGGSSSSSPGGSGTVAVLLADGPADDYDSIWIWITKISLIPESNSDSPVVVFESDDPDGWKADLLDLRDQDAVVTVKDNIPAGRYGKIRLYIADIQPEGGVGPCDPADMEIKLPSGKIDLNPKGGFEVIPGETISIRIDIDCDKSISLHPAGLSGKCIFRPVVFVEIEKIESPRKCPRILKGTIDEIFDENTGFILLLGEGRGPLTVYLTDDVIIFGEDGSPVDKSELDEDQTVYVRGRLDAEGDLRASVIVIGNVLLVKGTVATPFDGDKFTLELMPPHIFAQNIVDVAVSYDTFVMMGCDQEVDPDVIRAGMIARVVGKVSLENQYIQAIAVLLKNQRVIGTLTAISGPDVDGGYELTVQVSDTETVKIYMPSGVEPYMANLGPVSIDTIIDLLDCGRTLGVSITVFSQDSSILTATDVRVHGIKVEGVVESIKPKDDYGMVQVTLIGGKVVDIPESAIIKDYWNPGMNEPTNEDIMLGDNLLVVGLNTCQGDDYYEAYMVIILPSD